LEFCLWLGIFLALIAVVTGVYLWHLWSSNLPYVGLVEDYRPPVITEIFSADGEVIGRFWDEKRIVVALDGLPEHLIQAFVAAEDARFFSHEGVDLVSIVRAFFKNLIAGKIEQGGSTITQQVTRSLLLKNTARTYRRKAREAILSIQLEKNFSKQEILFLYLNQIYLGQGAYGVESAARTYFGKSVKYLNLAESALLAGLPQAPSRYSPVSHFARAKARQRYVLERMAREQFITESQLEKALQAELVLQTEKEDTFAKAPYFTEHVRRQLLERYGREMLYRGGLRIFTTVDLGMQQAAGKAVRKGLAELDKREGYRGPVDHLDPESRADFRRQAEREFAVDPPLIGSVVKGLVEKVDDARKLVIVAIGEKRALLPLKRIKWARQPNPQVAYYATGLKRPSEALEPGDVILVRIVGKGAAAFKWEVALEQKPLAQGALLCMVPQTGEVKAMVGGRDFTESQFNRAIQSRRQPGSAFKPIIYAAALEAGMTPAKILIDAPYVEGADVQEEAWRPKNYKEKFYGPTLFRTALAKSRNVITVKILRRIGVDSAIEYARKLGIESSLSPDLSLALGSSGISLLELTRAYAAFASGGMLVKPIFIKRITDRSGEVLEENHPVTRSVVSAENAYVMTDLLQAVIQEGTGWRIRALKRPAAGKTGTTNDLRDAWFMGYTPQLAAGVWVGYDDLQAMGRGETGSRAASPIWLDFMSAVHKDRPVIDFAVPEGVVFAKIDARTGLLASPHSEETVFQAFVEGTEPQEYTAAPTAAKTGQFMQFDMGQAQ
jgi:penicillin-binding protein 1A